MRFLKTSVIILLISLLAIPCFAEVPMLIEYSGELTRVNSKGKAIPYSPGTYDINFYICTDAMCTDVIWSETHSDIYISWGNTRGEFEVTLGEYNPLDDLVFNQDYWLLVTEEKKGYSKIEQLLTDPYGMRAEYANKAETVFDSETGEYKNLQDIVINNAYHAVEADHAEEADNADTVDGKHYVDIANEIDADIAAHRAIPDAHHRKTDSFTELIDMATDAQIPDNITIDYAATAGDADTVDGKHYEDIANEIDADIAAHKNIANAHHTKTTSFTELTDTATDAQIPNNITIDHAATAGMATEAGDADTLDGKDSLDFINDIEDVETALVNHKSDPDAHHTKTTSFTELTDTATDAQIPNNITIDHATSADSATTAEVANVVNRLIRSCGHPTDNPDYGDIYYSDCEGDDKVFIFTTDDVWKALDWAP